MTQAAVPQMPFSTGGANQTLSQALGDATRSTGQQAGTRLRSEYLPANAELSQMIKALHDRQGIGAAGLSAGLQSDYMQDDNSKRQLAMMLTALLR